MLEKKGNFRVYTPNKWSQWYCGMDLGLDDEFTLWFGYVDGGKYFVYHAYGNNFKNVEHYSEYIYDFMDKHEIEHPIKLILPHDSKKRDLVAGNTVYQEFERLGHEIMIMNKSQSLMNDIRSMRNELTKVVFHKEHCHIGYTHLKNYTKKYNKTTMRYDDTPIHNTSCNYADGARYLILGMKYVCESPSHFAPPSFFKKRRRMGIK